MEDESLKELLNKLKIGIIFIILISSSFLIMISKKFNASESAILTKIDKEDNLIILVKQTKCSNCKDIEKILKDKKVKYVVLNVDREKYYDAILKKIDLSKKDIKEPTIVYVKDQKLYSTLVDIKLEELNLYIENNNLSNK